MRSTKDTEGEARDAAEAGSAPSETDRRGSLSDLERLLMECCAPGNRPYSARRVTPKRRKRR